MKRLLFLMLPLLAISCNANSQTNGQLTGTVINTRSTPVNNVSVSIVTRPVKTALTNANGKYRVSNIPAGNYNVVFHATGFIDSVVRNVRIASIRTTTLNIRLRSAFATQPEVVKRVPVKDRKRIMRYEDMAAGAPTAEYAAPMPAMRASYKSAYFNPSTETYAKRNENDFMNVRSTPLSTLSVDVDRASYSNVRRFLNQGQKPPADAVRVEEMINYFDYDYPQPTGNDPIAIVTELTECPWNKEHKLLHVGLQAKKIGTDKLPASNLVFLLDVSGSMEEANKLPLVKSALKLLVDNLRPNDKVSIVVYAGNAGLVLPPTSGDHKTAIIDAMEKLQAGGSTAGGQGILLAYKTAEQNFIKGGNNRIILATDGDFNVGVSNENDLESLIVKEREKGIFLTCLGFGMGNYKDSKMELLADKGNGNYGYIDNIQEAQKMLVSEFGGTLFTVAKDVKAQIEFNAAKVQGYRLIGYENRLLNAEDFKDDKKDAAEMGSGHSVTILYEIIPTGIKSNFLRDVDGLKYQSPIPSFNDRNGELATIKFRYKTPMGNVSREMAHPIMDRTSSIYQASANTRFSASVAMFGMLLTNSQYKGNAAYGRAISLAEGARGNDKEGYRAEYIRLVKSAQ